MFGEYRESELNFSHAKATQLGCAALRSKSFLQIYDRHRKLVDRYELYNSQITMNLSLFTLLFCFPLSLTRLLPDLTTSNTLYFCTKTVYP